MGKDYSRPSSVPGLRPVLSSLGDQVQALYTTLRHVLSEEGPTLPHTGREIYSVRSMGVYCVL